MQFSALDKRIWIKGLTLECPLGRPEDDCPLNCLRGLPVSQMNAAINNLTDMQVGCIVTIHHHCFQERIRDIKRASR